MADEREVIRAHLLARLNKYEGNLYTLIRDVRELVPNVSRDAAQLAAGKVELVAAAIEKLIRSDGTDSDFDALHAASDQLILLRAQLDRKLRETARDEEDLELKQQRQRVRQLREEIEHELGAGQGGHGFGED